MPPNVNLYVLGVKKSLLLHHHSSGASLRWCAEACIQNNNIIDQYTYSQFRGSQLRRTAILPWKSRYWPNSRHFLYKLWKILTSFWLPLGTLTSSGILSNVCMSCTRVRTILHADFLHSWEVVSLSCDNVLIGLFMIVLLMPLNKHTPHRIFVSETWETS